jgi:AhpD family alkylhydroperoxidase
MAAPNPARHPLLPLIRKDFTMTATLTASPHGKEVLSDLTPLHRNLRQAIPDIYQGFGALSKAAFADGALDRKTKELIALAIGVVEGCDGCVASHGQAAARAGATRQEAAEAIGVTFLMHGGPATIHGARAYDAFCEFADALEAGEQPA